jgi:SMODS and SLOG-associating 2TM effector domain 1/SMODS and SLOG-associating 2TM effector domain 3
MLRSFQYPELRDAADRASSSAQKKFMWFQRLQLVALVIAAALAGWSPVTEHQRKSIAIFTFVAMGIGLAFSLALQFGEFDDHWFRCRAYAENMKSAAWKFAMTPEQLSSNAESLYLEEMENLRRRLPGEDAAILRYGHPGPSITDTMRAVQALDLGGRTSLYKKYRVEDQVKWYSDNSKSNQDRETFWYWVIFASQAVGVILAGLQISYSARYNSVGLVAAGASAFVAWLRVKRFSDLSITYAVAARDLRMICDQNRAIESEKAFSEFVTATEAAISREHSMWLARRDKSVTVG